MIYTDDQLLPLSGIQHFRYCPRQWGLIYIDCCWEENQLTYEGRQLHQHVDNPFYRSKHKDIIYLRSLSLISYRLGLSGIADLIELHHTDNEPAYRHPNYIGKWNVFPVEYKHGKPKKDDIDILQLVAQAICLEEMFNICVTEGAIYYGETQHRLSVPITETLRQTVTECTNAMHKLYSQAKVPIIEKSSKCRRCSLKDLCIPEIQSVNKSISAKRYNLYNLYEETS
ncbi:MAG: CRISPR-associated protein Cas4 [Bacteroides sp.]|nr:CRISPR-associated protein Cas4 [Bacteroides sp.]